MSTQTTTTPTALPQRAATTPPATFVSDIGTAEDNQRFLAWLTEHGDADMIARGCCLCRVIGHPFTVACKL